ncbi:SGNH/GDSL hydrolase family protein [Nocardioides yefusunii]|uniref:SGNH/GDSL hydrolase family protein n=1 Tax=Nocardioides yefusunii TaxID=2500546 RepID=A0ABW1R2U0_9ACTN
MAAVLGAGVAVAALPAVAHTPVWDKPTGQGNGDVYVALGDSFTAGIGIQPERSDDTGCHRSTKNFPSLVAADLDVSTFTDASCSGAVVADLATAQRRGEYDNDAQFDAITEKTTLVTFGTIGGNDMGLVGLATDCVKGDCVPAAGTDPLAREFTQLRTDLTAGIEKVKELAPLADIVVVGYGIYLPKDGCPQNFFDLVTAEESNYLQGQIDRLSDLLAEIAAENDVAFADQRLIPGALDHTVCQWDSRQWIRGLYPEGGGDGFTFHPSSAGMKATAGLVAGVVRDLRGVEPEPTPKPETTPTLKPTPKPTLAQRKAELAKKAKAVKVAATCAGTKKNRKVVVKATTAKGGVTKVVLKAGGKKVVTDAKAPFTIKVKATTLKKKLKKKSSTLKAVVTVKHSGLSTSRTVTLKRPGCVK